MNKFKKSKSNKREKRLNIPLAEADMSHSSKMLKRKYEQVKDKINKKGRSL